MIILVLLIALLLAAFDAAELPVDFQQLMESAKLDLNLFLSPITNQEIYTVQHREESSILPDGWEEVQDISSYPTDASGAKVIDAWDYLQRLSLYKYMIENINHCEWDRPGPDKYHRGNIIWGLPLQHGWQFSSGRLLTVVNETAIDSNSWWGCMNYYLSVLPYLGIEYP